MKLCIFPNDPIIAYYQKREIKERYFNPENLFDEIHIISFTDKEIDVSKVQQIAGNAKLIIHTVGKINVKNRKKEKNAESWTRPKRMRFARRKNDEWT